MNQSRFRVFRFVLVIGFHQCFGSEEGNNTQNSANASPDKRGERLILEELLESHDDSFHSGYTSLRGVIFSRLIGVPAVSALHVSKPYAYSYEWNLYENETRAA